jgi:hypothetical protein
MHRWGYSNATNCDCGHPCQTMDHIIDDCLIHSFEDGLLYLHEATPEAIQYQLSDLNIDSLHNTILSFEKNQRFLIHVGALILNLIIEFCQHVKFLR